MKEQIHQSTRIHYLIRVFIYIPINYITIPCKTFITTNHTISTILLSIRNIITYILRRNQIIRIRKNNIIKCMLFLNKLQSTISRTSRTFILLRINLQPTIFFFILTQNIGTIICRSIVDSINHKIFIKLPRKGIQTLCQIQRHIVHRQHNCNSRNKHNHFVFI